MFKYVTDFTLNKLNFIKFFAKVHTLSVDIPLEMIRNFSIVAHVDHGKTTLADRILEMTGAIKKSLANHQVMDQLELERSRGITIKAKTASLIYKHSANRYLLNLIDTPGHVDFSFEVSRALSACDGVVLLVDASQGPQAQTFAYFEIVKKLSIPIIPVLNKIDLERVDVKAAKNSLVSSLGLPLQTILEVSAKEGFGVVQLLTEIIERIPSPENMTDNPLNALIFDSYFDQNRGVVCIVAVKSGSIKVGDIVYLIRDDKSGYKVKEVGIFTPARIKTDHLSCGHVGYVILGIRDIYMINIGDTIFHSQNVKTNSSGKLFDKPQPIVFASLYPTNPDHGLNLRSSIQKLALNDSSVTVSHCSCEALGAGFKIGFLGQLHMEIFCQRLTNEFAQKFIITSPGVIYKAIIKKDQTEVSFDTPSEYPERCFVESYLEPFVKTLIITPTQHVDRFFDLCESRRGELVEMSHIDETTSSLEFMMPLVAIITNFSSKIRSISHGFASVSFEETVYKTSNVVKIEVLINNKIWPQFSQIIHEVDCSRIASEICSKLSLNMPRYRFEIDIKVTLRGKVISRKKIKPNTDDPTRKCYGGDVTRKMKLRSRQSKKLKELKKNCEVKIPREVYYKYMTSVTLD